MNGKERETKVRSETRARRVTQHVICHRVKVFFRVTRFVSESPESLPESPESLPESPESPESPSQSPSLFIYISPGTGNSPTHSATSLARALISSLSSAICLNEANKSFGESPCSLAFNCKANSTAFWK